MNMNTPPFTLSKGCVQKFVDLKFTKVDAEVVLEAWKNHETDQKKKKGPTCDFDVSMLDEDKMMAHLLDCYASLCAVQQFRVQKKKPSELDAKTQQAKNKVFKTAMSLMSTGMTHDDAVLPEYSPAFSKMVIVFPDDLKLTPKEGGENCWLTGVNWIPAEGRGWMPLHWAAIAIGTPEGDLHGLNEDDVTLICASDPLALSRHHFPLDHFNPDGCTPAHFLCMQPVTKCRMTLLRHFSTCNQQALVSRSADSSSSNYRTCLSLLHVACKYGQPTEDLLQFLLQLESSQTEDGPDEYHPLGFLCQNGQCNERLMKCLLDVDSSAEVVGNAIRGCIYSADHSNMLHKIDLLLKANPEAASFYDDSENGDWDCLLHSANRSNMPPALCIEVMKRILAFYPDAVKQVKFLHDDLPVHTAAKYGSLEAMEFLLGVYPESATITHPCRNPEDIDHYYYREEKQSQRDQKNLLHLVLSWEDTPLVEAKMRFLCSRYPEMLSQRGGNGITPFIQVLSSVKKFSIVRLMCEIGTGPALVRIPSIHPIEQGAFDYYRTDEYYDSVRRDHWLPLHFYVASSALVGCSPVSEFADFFRLMLRWYPEAAGMEGTYEDHGGDRSGQKTTPYHLAVDNGLDPYYLRLLLRAAPDLNPAELHRLNWAERRMAMFLSVRAITKAPTLLLFARLRCENKDLVKHVVSFL